DDDIGALVSQALFESPPRLTYAAPEPLPVGHRRLESGREADCPGHVVGTRTTAQLLAASMDHRLEGHTIADDQRPNSLGTAEFVAGDSEQVEPVEGHLLGDDGLHGVGMDQHRVGNASDGVSHFGDRLDDTRLVVGPHHRDQPRFVGHLRRYGLGIDQSPSIDAEDRDRAPHTGHEFHRFQHRFVLGRHGHHTTSVTGGEGGALDGEVVGFGATTREHDLQWLALQHRRHAFACFLEGVLGAARDAVHAGWVAEQVGAERLHGLEDLRPHRSGGSMVDVEHRLNDPTPVEQTTTVYAELVPPVSVSVLIAAPLDAVWEAASDLTSHPEWMADAESIRFADEQRRGVGTTMEVATRVGPFRVSDWLVVTAWEDRRLIEIVHVGSISGWGRFRLDPLAGGIRFTWTEQLHFPWWLGGPVVAYGAQLVLSLIW